MNLRSASVRWGLAVVVFLLALTLVRLRPWETTKTPSGANTPTTTAQTEIKSEPGAGIREQLTVGFLPVT